MNIFQHLLLSPCRVSSRGGGGGEASPPKEKEKEREKEREVDRREVREQHIFGYYDITRNISLELSN